jgi:Tfp pilus assembly protein PilO
MNLSRRDQYLLALLVVILIGFGFFRLAYMPMSKEIKTVIATNQQLQLDKQELQAQVKQHPKKTEETEDKFAHLNKRLPTEDEMIPLLTMLDETTGKYGLPFASLDYKGAEKPDETGAQTLVFAIGTKGKIAELFNFLDELEKAERLISVEDVSFNAVKTEAQVTAEAVEPGPPAYYIAPPGIPEAKLQRIKFEIAEEKEEISTESERPVAKSFTPGLFDMKITVKAYYAAAADKSAPVQAADGESKPVNGSGGEV